MLFFSGYMIHTLFYLLIRLHVVQGFETHFRKLRRDCFRILLHIVFRKFWHDIFLILGLQRFVVFQYDCSCLYTMQIEISGIIPTPEEGAKNMLIGNDVCQGRIKRSCLFYWICWCSTVRFPGMVEGFSAIRVPNFCE